MPTGTAVRVTTGAVCLALVLASLACKPEPKASPTPAAGAGATAASPAAGAATSTTDAPRSSGFVVYASFYPLAYFAERIGGKHVTVHCPVPADADPAYWMPSPELVLEFQKADVVLVNGASYEKWLDKVSLPESRVVNTSAALAEEYIVLESAVQHSHGPAGAHAHEGVDGHTWLDPRTARVQAEAVLEAFASRFPAPTDEFNANFTKLAADLEELAARAEALSPRLADQVLLASHPAYNYLARQFHWNVHTLMLDPAEEPSEDEWALLRDSLGTMPTIILLWEQEPRQEIADRMLEDFGLLSVVFNPGETRSPAQAAEGVDYIKLMHANFQRLEDAVGMAAAPGEEPADSSE